ncbi:hypothetical protein Ctob_002204 [Chrysochromulina tobinii]|uniref:AAA+ ATPase domain-containing protein n=1 Tax=Chrysochromulina tobinii TaxID=1460289 RepID=A0A0M0JT24_9EUKA|nr:hypothetical protein Ctob_002204 [Chrysochromulina tobinii]|eukprot:KOO29333.1 hypothetical protein Ctob_002204 [Chrysochromulina sp. CCMP291]
MSDKPVEYADFHPAHTMGSFDSFVDKEMLSIVKAKVRLLKNQIVGKDSKAEADTKSISVPSFPLHRILLAAGQRVVDYWSLDTQGSDEDIDRLLNERIEVRLGEAAELLRAMPTGSADVVYFDPMFTRPVKADTSFETLRPLAYHEALSAEAIAQARRVARRLVLVTDQPASGELERLGLRVVWNGQRKRYGAIESLQAEATGAISGVVEIAAGAAEELRLGLATQGALGIRCYDWVLIERGVCAIACRAALDPSVPDGSAMLPEWMHAQLRAAAHDDAHDDGAPTAHDSAAAAHDSASAGPVGQPLVGRLSAVVSAERVGLLRDDTAVGLAPSRALTVALRVTFALARRGARDGAIQAEGEDDDAVGLALAAASSSEASAVSSAEDDELEREREEGPPRRRVDGRPIEGPPHAPSRAASAPRALFDAAALGAARRQLLGLPLLLGGLCAVQRLDGVAVLRVCGSGRLAAALDAPFDEARRAVPSVLLLSELGLLAPAAPASSGAGADSEGGVHTQSAAGTGGVTALGVAPPSGALLYGPSGNGKSLLASCLAAACGWPTFCVKGSQLFGAYVGETEAAIRELFRKARENAPSIVLLDELDAIGGSRGDLGEASEQGGGGTAMERALSTLLNEMDGVGIAGPKFGSSSSTRHSFGLGASSSSSTCLTLIWKSVRPY